MTYKRPESVLVVIYNHHGRVLVLQRIDDDSFWQSVTGSLEADELPLQTALREVREETGIDIIAQGFDLNDCRQVNQYQIRQQWRHRYAPDVSVNTEYVFSVCVNHDVAIHLTEHLQYCWLDKAEAISRVWSETNKQAIRQCVPAPNNI